MFYHSLISDWNHGNAHFLRGVATELQKRGHEVHIYEPHDAWSLAQLRLERGDAPIARFHELFPHLESRRYMSDALDLDEVLAGAGLVLVHEWNDPQLVRRIGEHRARVGGYRLFFHDTHHRAVTAPEAMAGYDLRHYDGVLAFGAVLRDLYLERGWAARAWTWHEAADTRLFRPQPEGEREGELVWVGNWGDEERSAEIREYLVEPVAALGLRARIYGVRYPEAGLRALAEAGIEYAGWLANYEVPGVFGRYRVTVHVPRRPYVEHLPGIPTIRVFEALACGIPLVSAPWEDVEGLFTPGLDYLVARSGDEMKRLLRDVLSDETLARELAARGVSTVHARHTCAHRAAELLEIYQTLEVERGEGVLAG